MMRTCIAISIATAGAGCTTGGPAPDRVPSLSTLEQSEARESRETDSLPEKQKVAAVEVFPAHPSSELRELSTIEFFELGKHFWLDPKREFQTTREWLDSKHPLERESFLVRFDTDVVTGEEVFAYYDADVNAWQVSLVFDTRKETNGLLLPSGDRVGPEYGENIVIPIVSVADGNASFLDPETKQWDPLVLEEVELVLLAGGEPMTGSQWANLKDLTTDASRRQAGVDHIQEIRFSRSSRMSFEVPMARDEALKLKGNLRVVLECAVEPNLTALGTVSRRFKARGAPFDFFTTVYQIPVWISSIYLLDTRSDLPVARFALSPASED